MTSSDDRQFSPPRAIARVLRVIEVLAVEAGRRSLAELSVAMEVPKSSLFAILKGLEQEGYVTLDKDLYAIGPKAFRLADAIRGGRTLAQRVRPVLESMGAATGETVILATLAADRANVEYTVVVESDSWLRFSVSAGTRRPLNSGASGHAVLAWMPPSERDRYVAAERFERFTPNTVASATALRKVIARARRAGAAMTVDGTVTGATGIAAPYFDRNGNVAGSILIAAPTARVAGREQEITNAARRGAEAVSRLLSYAGAYPPAAP